VIDGRPDDRQPERHVHRSSEGEQLDRDQPLIVIAGNHGIELATHGADEYRVTRQRPLDADAPFARGGNGRHEHILLFVTQQPVFSGVRIQSGERQPRRGDAEPRQLLRGQRDDLVEQRARQRARHIRQRHVHGGQHHLQRLGPEHHGHAAAAGQVAEQIRVPLPRESCMGQCELVDWRRRHAVHHAVLRIADRGTDGVVGSATGRRRERAGLECGTRWRAIDHRLTRRPHPRIGRRLIADLRPDAGRITRGERDTWLHKRSASQSTTTFGLTFRSSASSASSTA
jgi:hypothetical protein